ncbi:MAG: PqqD family protein [Candidatus Muiribacteriota bacterium]|jgi:hypothetical protein
MNPETKITSPDSVLYTQVGDEIIILDLTSGKYFSLNHTAADIFKLFVKEKLSFGEVYDKLAILYPEADSITLKKDIRELAEDLKKSGIFFY